MALDDYLYDYAYIENIVGPPKTVYGELMGALYFEASQLIWLSACVMQKGDTLYCSPDGKELSFERNQAICVGLLVRMSKFMLSVHSLAAGVGHNATIQALNRCILESAVNLRFLIAKKIDNDNEAFDNFVASGLQVVQEYSNEMEQNMQDASGGQGPDPRVIKNASDMFQEMFEMSRLEVSQVKPGADKWRATSFRVKLEQIFEKIKEGPDKPPEDLNETQFLNDSYRRLQSIPSSAVHGDWADLHRNHLQFKENGFVPDYSYVDDLGFLLGVAGQWALAAASDYVDVYFTHLDVESLRQRLGNVLDRLMMVEKSHPFSQFLP